jgi:glycerophosphoryl diester phosphodiesterase
MIIAHRGASKEKPENTIAAINHAIMLGAQFVEIDVRLSKEGIPIVLHDPSPARMTGKKNTSPIRKLLLPQIKTIDISGHKIPTLEEVLNLTWENTGLMIEIKQGVKDLKMLVDAIFHVFENIKNLPQIIIGSFSLDIMHTVKNHPNMKKFNIDMIGIIEKRQMIFPFLELDMKRLALWHKLIKPENINEIQKKVDIWAFTVDSPETAKQLISLGISGIISNDPKTMIENLTFPLK